jgi:hemolysin activation/secretion protein
MHFCSCLFFVEQEFSVDRVYRLIQTRYSRTCGERFSMLIRIAAAFSFLLLAAASAQAQTPPNIGDALRQSQAPPMPPQAPPPLPQIGGAPIEPQMNQLPGGPTVEVKALVVKGNRVIDTATLQGLVADGAGKSLGLHDLEDLALRITKYYRAHGYFVARAYIPAQEITSGTVKIRVVEGNYGKFLLTNKSLVRDSTVQAMLDDVKRYDIVSLDTLERAMLIINDTPGVRVTRADVMPGEKVGTSDFAVDTAPTPAYDGFVAADNYGSVYTGHDRLSFNVDANSPLGIGDRLSVSGLLTDGGGLLNGGGAYSLPLAPNGLRGQIDVNKTTYQLGGIYDALDAVGMAKSIDAGVTYPLRRTREQTITLSGGVSYRDLLDEIRSTGTDTPKTLKSFNFGASIRDEARLFGANGLTQANASLVHGVLDINEGAAQALDAAGPRAAGAYSKIDLNASRSSLLPRTFTLDTALRLQQTLGGKTLDGSERMAASGIGGVVAAPPGEAIGDDARYAHVDLSHPFAQIAATQTSWQVFTDYGQTNDARPLGTNSERHVSDIGVGLDAGAGNGPMIHAALAHRMQQEPPVSEPYPKTKFLIQVGWVF